MEITAVPIFDANGEVVQVVETSRVTGSQRMAECRLDESEVRYQRILETILIPFFSRMPDAFLWDATLLLSGLSA